MQSIKIPLWIMTIIFVLSFMDGAFVWGLDDGTYIIFGLTQIVALIWMWVIVKTND